MLSFRRLCSKFPAGTIPLRKNINQKSKSSNIKKESMDRRKYPSYSEYRFWTKQSGDQRNDQSNQYKLMSYNILAQDLLTEHMQLYLGIDTSFLRWEYRLKKLKTEISTLKPDIICLQEMQYTHLKMFMKAIDNGRKFEYVFKKKTGTRTDGCAIIYDRKKFKLLDDYAVEYYKAPRGSLNRDNIAVIAKLTTRTENPKEFLVATTHLLFNLKREDVRQAQIHLLLSELERHSQANGIEDEQNTAAKNSNRLPILLTGDFNFQPFTRPHELVLAGTSILRRPPSFNSNENNQRTLSHSLHMSSAYGEYYASTFQDKWILVDYIFYSSEKSERHIKILSLYALPSVRFCSEMGMIPNARLGSDHLCLAVKFSIEK